MERLGKPRHRRADRRLNEWEVSESNLWLYIKNRDSSTSLGMTKEANPRVSLRCAFDVEASPSARVGQGFYGV